MSKRRVTLPENYYDRIAAPPNWDRGAASDYLDAVERASAATRYEVDLPEDLVEASSDGRTGDELRRWLSATLVRALEERRLVRSDGAGSGETIPGGEFGREQAESESP